MNRKPVIVVGVIVLLSVIFTMVFMSISDEDLNVAMTAFRNSTQGNTPVQTDKVIREIEKDSNGINLGQSGENGDPSIAEPYMPGAPDGSKWMQIVADTKNIIATQIGYYEQAKIENCPTVTLSDGTTAKLRPDCSGFVGFCLWRMGLQGSSVNINSASGSSGGTIPGVECHAMSELSNYSELRPGDIVFKSGHVEIIAESPAPGSGPTTPAKVYNCGSNDSAAVPGVTSGTALGKYTYFWRIPQ